MRQHKTTSGFTLVEMLVVIGIIVVLVAILFPVFSSAKNKATMAECTGQLQQLVTALKQYRIDYGKYPPRPTYNAAAQRYTGGFSSLYPDYIDSWDTLVCPADRDIDMKQREAKSRVYSSYNGRAENPQQDNWDFLVSSGVTYITYNYHGYDANGWDMDTPETTNLPAWLSAEGRGWKHYPRLMNRNAPDYTVVTHCIFHRDFYHRDTDKLDIVVRLNGDASTQNVSQWSAVGANGGSPFQVQSN